MPARDATNGESIYLNGFKKKRKKSKNRDQNDA